MIFMIFTILHLFQKFVTNSIFSFQMTTKQNEVQSVCGITEPKSNHWHCKNESTTDTEKHQGVKTWAISCKLVQKRVNKNQNVCSW